MYDIIKLAVSFPLCYVCHRHVCHSSVCFVS